MKSVRSSSVDSGYSSCNSCDLDSQDIEHLIHMFKKLSIGEIESELNLNLDEDNSDVTGQFEMASVQPFNFILRETIITCVLAESTKIRSYQRGHAGIHLKKYNCNQNSDLVLLKPVYKINKTVMQNPKYSTLAMENLISFNTADGAYYQPRRYDSESMSCRVPPQSSIRRYPSFLYGTRQVPKIVVRLNLKRECKFDDGPAPKKGLLFEKKCHVNVGRKNHLRKLESKQQNLINKIEQVRILLDTYRTRYHEPMEFEVLNMDLNTLEHVEYLLSNGTGFFYNQSIGTGTNCGESLSPISEYLCWCGADCAENCICADGAEAIQQVSDIN